MQYVVRASTHSTSPSTVVVRTGTVKTEKCMVTQQPSYTKSTWKETQTNIPGWRIMADELPVPAQLQTQLGKCKTVRSSDYYKPRTKTPQARKDPFFCFSSKPIAAIIYYGMQRSFFFSSFVSNLKEMEASKAKLPPLPTASK